MTPRVVKKSGQIGKVKVKGLSKIGDTYYFRPPQVEGVRPPRESLKTKDFDKAVSLALEKMGQKKPVYTPGTVTFEIERFKKARAGLSPWTIETDYWALRNFCLFVGESTAIKSVTAKVLKDWRSGLAASMADGSVTTYFNKVRALFKWLDLTPNPISEIEYRAGTRVTKARFCTKDQRATVLAACQGDILVMAMLGFHAGMRANEIVEARSNWLRFWDNGGEIFIQKTDTFTPKNKKERRIPMNSILYAFLRDRKFSGEYLVFDDVRRQNKKQKYRFRPDGKIQPVKKATGMKWVGWHTMRHTYATLLVMGGCPIATVAQWLGDGIQLTYDTYVGYLPNETHINAAL